VSGKADVRAGEKLRVTRIGNWSLY